MSLHSITSHQLLPYHHLYPLGFLLAFVGIAVAFHVLVLSVEVDQPIVKVNLLYPFLGVHRQGLQLLKQLVELSAQDQRVH